MRPGHHPAVVLGLAPRHELRRGDMHPRPGIPQRHGGACVAIDLGHPVVPVIGVVHRFVTASALHRGVGEAVPAARKIVAHAGHLARRLPVYLHPVRAAVQAQGVARDEGPAAAPASGHGAVAGVRMPQQAEVHQTLVEGGVHHQHPILLVGIGQVKTLAALGQGQRAQGPIAAARHHQDARAFRLQPDGIDESGPACRGLRY